MGRDNRAILTLVRTMPDQGNAVAIMANQELNSLLYHQPGLNADGTDDGYIRAYCAKNRTQHQTLLGEFPVGHKHTAEMLKWFLTLPLFLDLGGLRLIGACGDDVRIETILALCLGGLLTQDDLQKVALEKGANGFA